MLQNGNPSNILRLATISPIKAIDQDAKSRTICGTVVKVIPTKPDAKTASLHFNLKDANDETTIIRIAAFGNNAKKWESYITDGKKYKLSRLKREPATQYKSAQETEDFRLIIEEDRIIELCSTQSLSPTTYRTASAMSTTHDPPTPSFPSEGRNLAQALNFLPQSRTPPAFATVPPMKSDLKRKTSPSKSSSDSDISTSAKAHENECKAISRNILAMLRKVDPDITHQVSLDLQAVCTKYIDEHNEKKRRLSEQTSTSQ